MSCKKKELFFTLDPVAALTDMGGITNNNNDDEKKKNYVRTIIHLFEKNLYKKEM